MVNLRESLLVENPALVCVGHTPAYGLSCRTGVSWPPIQYRRQIDTITRPAGLEERNRPGCRPGRLARRVGNGFGDNRSKEWASVPVWGESKLLQVATQLSDRGWLGLRVLQFDDDQVARFLVAGQDIQTVAVEGHLLIDDLEHPAEPATRPVTEHPGLKVALIDKAVNRGFAATRTGVAASEPVVREAGIDRGAEMLDGDEDAPSVCRTHRRHRNAMLLQIGLEGDVKRQLERQRPRGSLLSVEAGVVVQDKDPPLVPLTGKSDVVGPLGARQKHVLPGVLVADQAGQTVGEGGLDHRNHLPGQAPVTGDIGPLPLSDLQTIGELPDDKVELRPTAFIYSIHMVTFFRQYCSCQLGDYGFRSLPRNRDNSGIEMVAMIITTRRIIPEEGCPPARHPRCLQLLKELVVFGKAGDFFKKRRGEICQLVINGLGGAETAAFAKTTITTFTKKRGIRSVFNTLRGRPSPLSLQGQGAKMRKQFLPRLLFRLFGVSVIASPILEFFL